MFDLLFQWRKASKCKKLIKHVQCRLKFLKIKRESTRRRSRDDIAQLLKAGLNEQAFSRVGQLFKEQNLQAAYDLLDHFCELIIIHFPYIRKHKDCPDDINEAVSTLIYAAQWCGDLPELKKIQKLFGERYGRKFVKAAVELYHGTLVNSQIREKLGGNPIPENVALRLMNEIVKEYCFLQKGDLEFNYKSFSGGQTPAPNPEELKVECSYEPRTIHSLLLGQSSLESCGSNKPSAVSLENLVEMGNSKPASSDISLFQFQESDVNFDEVQELEFNKLQDLFDEDKRTFLFNPSIYKSRDSYIFGGESLWFLSSYGCGEKGPEIGEHTSYSRTTMIGSPEKMNCTATLNNSTEFPQNAITAHSHVHPKLPDYDELAAKFLALKKEHQQKAATGSLNVGQE